MKLLKAQLVNAQHARLVYSLTLREGQTYESLFIPSTWAHVAREIPVGTIVEVTPHDGEWFARVLVRARSDLSVVVGAIEKVDFGAIAQMVPEEYEPRHRGRAKWCVMRLSDRKPMIEGLGTREEAEAWIKNPVAKAA